MNCQRETIMFQPQIPALPITSLKELRETECKVWQNQGKLGPGRGGSSVWLKMSWRNGRKCVSLNVCLVVYFFFFSEYPNQQSKVCAGWQQIKLNKAPRVKTALAVTAYSTPLTPASKSVQDLPGGPGCTCISSISSKAFWMMLYTSVDVVSSLRDNCFHYLLLPNWDGQ